MSADKDRSAVFVAQQFRIKDRRHRGSPVESPPEHPAFSHVQIGVSLTEHECQYYFNFVLQGPGSHGMKHRIERITLSMASDGLESVRNRRGQGQMSLCQTISMPNKGRVWSDDRVPERIFRVFSVCDLRRRSFELMCLNRTPSSFRLSSRPNTTNKHSHHRPHYGDFAPHPYPQPQPPPMDLYPHSRPLAASFAPSQGRIFDRQADNHRGAALRDVYSSTFRVADSSNNGIDTSFRHTSPQSHATENENEEAENDDLGGDGEKRKHACSMCGKRFNRPSSLRIHLNTHTGAKPYVCPFPGCNRQFNVSSNMRRHYRNHARRAPPPLPLNDVLAQAEAARAQAQTQLQMHNQMQTQRAFSIEPPSHMQPGQSVPSEVKPPNMQRSADETTNMVRGAEAAARAARRLSIPPSSVPVADPISAARQSASTIPRPRPPVQYEYPYPPASSHSNSNAHSNAQPTSWLQSHNHSAYLQNSSRSIDLLAGREYSYPAYSTTRHGDGSVPETDSSFGNLPPLSSTHVTVPLSSSGWKQGSCHNIPPTPPYTSEAAHSPPLHTSLHDLPSNPERRDLSYYGPERDQYYTATAYEGENLRDSGHQTDHAGLVYRDRDAGRLTRYDGGEVRSMSPARAHHAPSLCSEPVGEKLDEHLPRYASYSSVNEGDYLDGYPRPRAHTNPREYCTRRQDSLRQHDDSGYISATQSTDSHVRDAGAIISPATSRQSTEKTHVEKGAGVRQQPSPDTPSLHVSALHSEHPHDDDTGVAIGADKHGPASVDSTRKGQGSFAAGTAEKVSLVHARGTSRSSLQLHELIHPVEQPPATQMARSPTDHAIANESEVKTEKSTPIGRTPGAAPPPPYPLYTRPPPAFPGSPYSDPEKIDELKTEVGCEASTRKKRASDVAEGRAEKCSRGAKKRRRG
ncbi:uncharacterized protein FOMMEDRAFT_144426 [Fomitiporia mediterranea MF3/22]|uniref:uncharacterized protein n=1 Tax=Fomitiporia mediterranea (strain MF3/22) TaxID=694068 RepID=UPI000440838B|nr:uncharacterized protein FOMMEDRAFT_144426 [Fomitiporia mediterranea MF3/22]EJD06315.1 hypothetical protein FOMMEDRAFT_144426 [Fomitiporia mediterranea MF3/22]